VPPFSVGSHRRTLALDLSEADAGGSGRDSETSLEPGEDLLLPDRSSIVAVARSGTMLTAIPRRRSGADHHVAAASSFASTAC
jgi:hypothetical protein